MSDVVIKINDKTMKELEAFPDKVVYAVARETLDRVGSSKITPYKTGKTEMTMFQAGVRGSNRDYSIGNFTNYASYVYAMPQSVNWTNPLSKAQWFETFWKSSGKSVLENVVARYKI
jgi:hypothetical protein